VSWSEHIAVTAAASSTGLPPRSSVRIRLRRRIRRPERRERGLVRREDHRPRFGRGEHLEAHAEPCGERQQVPHRDRPIGGDGVRQRSVHPAQYPRSGQLREQAVDGLVETERAFASQSQDERARDRLGRRRDPEERVPAHRITTERQHAVGLHVHLVAARHQRHQPGHLAQADMRRRDLAEAYPPVPAQPDGHSCSPLSGG
jgi:hypothetical protein